jgi:hypothetical protein
MLDHQKHDDFLKGTYAKMNGRFRGCAVGCSVQSLNVKRGTIIEYDDHAALGKAIGIPEWLFRLQDALFEGLPEIESKKFPVKFFKVIPVGKDLEPVKWKFCAFILKENIERVLTLKIDDSLKEKVVSAIQGVLKIHETAIETGTRSARSAADSAESAARSAARSARSAAWAAADSARSAAWSAAESAAWSAADSAARSADSAAWSAAESAAWAAADSAWAAAESAWAAADSAAYIKYADELLRLLEEMGG